MGVIKGGDSGRFVSTRPISELVLNRGEIRGKFGKAYALVSWGLFGGRLKGA